MTFNKRVLVVLAAVMAATTVWACTETTKDEDLYYFETPPATRTEILISEYDHIMREQGAIHGYDWRLLSAIGYHESRFLNDVVSNVGALGIMQVMPAVARAHGVSEDEVVDPHTNVATAARVLRSIEQKMRYAPSVSDVERLKFTLACYNGGLGHVCDAVRLARKYGASGTRWDDVSKYLLLKSDPDYYTDECVRNGRFAGRETVSFVSAVINKYEEYCSKYPH